MYMMLVPILLSLLCQAALSVNPGLKLRVTQNALNYAATQAIHSLKIEGEILPEIKGSDEIAVGNVDYDITNTQVRSFTLPHSDIAITTGEGIQWTISGSSAWLSGHWHYHWTSGIFYWTDHGTFDLMIENANLILKATVGKDQYGNATIKYTDCGFSDWSVTIKLSGGFSWLYDLFIDVINGMVEDQLKIIICKIGANAINIDAELALSKAQLIQPIHNTGVLNYSLLIPPIFASGYIDTYHKGEIFWYGSTEEAPFSPDPFPETFQRDKMVYIWISDYLMNTAGYVLQNHGILKYFLKPSDLPPDTRYQLNTTCPNKQCIGNFLSKVQDEFPGCTMSMKMATSKPPTLDISPGDFYGKFEGNIAYYVTFPNGTNVYVFNTFVKANVSLSLSIIGNKITAKVAEHGLIGNITVVDSAIGNISSEVLTWSFQNLLVPQFVIPQFNAIGEKGLYLPSTDQVSFVNSDLKFVQDALLIGIDLKWTPNMEKRPDTTLYFSAHQ